MIIAQVDKTAKKELKAALKAAKQIKWYRRLKIIDLSAQGHSAPKVGKMFDLSAATVRIYIKRYNQGGLAGLAPDYGAGRKATLNWSKNEWADLLNQAPSQFEKLESGAQN